MIIRLRSSAVAVFAMLSYESRVLSPGHFDRRMIADKVEWDDQ